MHKHFRGDTLIEVAIAIAIFSLVAISVVAVINTSTSSVQTTLETTETRNEIDAQAEALRFIHDAYEAEKDLASSEQTYKNLWTKIKELANANKDLVISDFTPTTCSELYETNTQSPNYKNSIFSQNAFVLNPKLLNSNPDNALLSVKTNANIFTAASLYPRIFTFSANLGALTAEDLENSNNNLRAEGLYIIPVADKGTAISTDGGGITSQTSYYDFYIRSCWYAAGADTPSTISTVVRLYDPDVAVVDSQLISYALVFDTASGETTVPTKTRDVRATETTFELEQNDYSKKTANSSQKMLGWALTSSTNPCGESLLSSADAKSLWNLTSNSTSLKVTSANPTAHLSPIWQCTYSISYNKNTTDTVTNMPSTTTTTATTATKTYTISNKIPVRAGYFFCGWKDSSNNIYSQPSQCSSASEFNSANVTYPTSTTTLGISWTGYNQSLSLNAIWKRKFTLNYYNNDGTTIYKSIVKLGEGSSYTFTIGEDAPTSTLANSSGTLMTFMGWSLNKDGSGTIYKKGGGDDTQSTITDNFATYSNGVINLYPVWRVKISFNSVDWKTSNSNGKGTISISNTSTGGQVVFTGHRYGPVDVKVYYEIGVNDIFELSADMVTSGMKTHPGGFIEIRIGPITTQITKPSDYSNNIKVTSSCNSSSTSKNITLSTNTVNVKMTKYGDNYAMSFNDETFTTCTVSNYSNPITVSYRMYHYSHACSVLFGVTLKNIKMMRLIQD